MNALHKRQI